MGSTKAFLKQCAAALAVCGCGAGTPVFPSGSASSSIDGFVVKGPLSAGLVTAYRLDEQLRRGDALSSAVTDGNGAFHIDLPPYGGDILLVASSGSYTEEAVGNAVKLDGAELMGVVPRHAAGSAVSSFPVTPVSHLAYALARYLVQSGGSSAEQAVADSWSHLSNHFGALDWQSIVPTDLNAAQNGLLLGDQDRAGLILAGLSSEALGVASRAKMTPGVGVTTMDLLAALEDDVATDGFFDGVGAKGPISVPRGLPVIPDGAVSATPLDGQTLRLNLVSAIGSFLSSPRNHTGLTLVDARSMADTISQDNDSRLFRGDGVDHSAPSLAFATLPAQYTNLPSIKVRVWAQDAGVGVAHVYAQNGALPSVEARLDGGYYVFDLALPLGSSTFAVWAVDNIGNSSQSTSQALSFTVLYDDGPPTILPQNVPSYIDERTMELVESAPGVPVMPAEYSFGAATKSVVTGGVHIFKSSTRLSWGDSTPTGMDLLHQDPATRNVPFLVMDVPFDASKDSPIVGATFDLKCTTCPDAPLSSGTLLQDSSATGVVRLVLPLADNVAPWLDTLPGASLLRVAIVVTDAAGNSSKGQTDVTFHVIGGPLSWTEDSVYTSDGDPHSTFPYLVSTGTYGRAFSASDSAFSADGLVRIVRYVLRNPSSVPVAASLRASGYADEYESWSDDTHAWQSTGGEERMPDGSLLDRLYAFGAACNEPAYPCYSVPGQNGLMHNMGDGMGTLPYFCHAGPYPTAHSNPEHVDAHAALASTSFTDFQPRGGESAQAPQVAGFAVIPAASGANPGVLVVYVSRPANTPRQTVLQWQDVVREGGTSASYQVWRGDFWNNPSPGSCGVDASGSPLTFDAYSGTRWYQHLASARTQLNGSVSVSTQGLTQNAQAVVGEVRPLVTGQDLTRSIPH